ncbi:MAG TPA: FtsL-like putative cell division protein [Bacteroidia bacterium]|nr:FtsL-like putative cell division protein [Bacteroidia bacterium]HRH07975.1 FtsL-like putative cell division protein [Bacteroidia bacterium]HRH63106.1 FtsL-like putative cell division protein [Bacteroidia bacterium]
MAEIKEPTSIENGINDEATTSSVASSPKKSGKKDRPIIDFINGNFLTNASAVKQVPFVFFLVFVAIVYISNTYYAEKILRKTNSVTNEIKELRSEYITSKSDLMFISKQSEVARAAAEMNLGIKESVVAPKKIIIEKEEQVQENTDQNSNKLSEVK